MVVHASFPGRDTASRAPDVAQLGYGVPACSAAVLWEMGGTGTVIAHRAMVRCRGFHSAAGTCPDRAPSTTVFIWMVCRPFLSGGAVTAFPSAVDLVSLFDSQTPYAYVARAPCDREQRENRWKSVVIAGAPGLCMHRSHHGGTSGIAGDDRSSERGPNDDIPNHRRGTTMTQSIAGNIDAMSGGIVSALSRWAPFGQRLAARGHRHWTNSR